MTRSIIMNNQKRRTLLKALGVAPIIYTLPNGNVLANTSSTCNSDPDNTVYVTKQYTTPESSDYQLVDSQDNVYIQTGDYYTRSNDTGTVYYFDGNNEMLVGSCWNSITLNGQYPERWY